MSEVYEFTVQFEEERADRFIQRCLVNFSRSAVQSMMSEGLAVSGGKVLAKNSGLKPGDIVTVTVPEPVMPDIIAEDIPLDIVYEDGDLLVVNKPKGMVVHPAPGNYTGTLVNALMFYCRDSLSGINGVMRPGIVHRIDKDTSGLLMVAKNDYTHLGLSEQIRRHSFKRCYSAVVYGNVKKDVGTVNAPVGRNPFDRKKMAVITGRGTARDACTHYEVIARFEGFTQLKLRLETGRTHQIRVHMAYVGHPVAGDPVYGPKKVITELHGQCLHAGEIGFVHPVTMEYMEFEAPLPEYFVNFISKQKPL